MKSNRLEELTQHYEALITRKKMRYAITITVYTDVITILC